MSGLHISKLSFSFNKIFGPHFQDRVEEAALLEQKRRRDEQKGKHKAKSFKTPLK